MRFLAVAVIVSGWAYAGWKNLPPMADRTAGVAAFSIIACCLACWWIGRQAGRNGAVAIASARAEARAAAAARSLSTSVASNTVNVQLVTADGAREVAAREFALPEWVQAPVVQQLEQDSDQGSAEEAYLGVDEQTAVHDAP